MIYLFPGNFVIHCLPCDSAVWTIWQFISLRLHHRHSICSDSYFLAKMVLSWRLLCFLSLLRHLLLLVDFSSRKMWHALFREPNSFSHCDLVKWEKPSLYRGKNLRVICGQGYSPLTCVRRRVPGMTSSRLSTISWYGHILFSWIGL